MLLVFQQFSTTFSVVKPSFNISVIFRKHIAGKYIVVAVGKREHCLLPGAPMNLVKR
jgi:formyltetrahydrofolate hydrolase